MNIKRLNNKIDYISKFLNKKFNKKISNKSEFIKDSYYLNKLIHDFYLISKSNLTKTQKINKLANQTDPYGQKIINKRIAKQLLEDNSRDIIKLYDKLYSYKINQKSNRNITGGAQMVQDVNQQFNNLNNSLGKNLIGFVDQSSKFLKPVYCGDTIYPIFEINELSPNKSTGVMGLDTKIYNQNKELVLQGIQRYLIKL